MSPPRLYSMTGFGSARIESPHGHFAAEVKSVNSRFLEIRVGLPSALSALEIPLRNLLKSRLSRGKLDVRIRHTPAAGEVLPGRINEPVLNLYLEQLRAMRDRLELKDEIRLDRLLDLPGVVESEAGEIEAETFWPPVAEVVGAALDRFEAERAREGAALGGQLLGDLEILRRGRESILSERESVMERYREKLRARIAELEEQTRAKLEPGRLEIEAAMYADRADVSEEMTRLEAHLDRFENIVRSETDEPAGKALDFLLQEILREVNTTASKMRDSGIVAESLEMKAAVERLREQVQNLE